MVIWILDILLAVIGENLRFSLKDVCLLDLRDKKLLVFYLFPPYPPHLLSCYFIKFSVI